MTTIILLFYFGCAVWNVITLYFLHFMSYLEEIHTRVDWFFWESLLAYLPVFVGSRCLALFHSPSSTIWRVFCALSFLQAIYGLFCFIYFYMIKRESLLYFKTFFDYHATEIWHTWLFLLNPQKFLSDRNLSYPTIWKNKSVQFVGWKLLLSVVHFQNSASSTIWVENKKSMTT